MTAPAVERWYPDVPPALPGETDAAYTDRITGADGTGRVPYDHRRGRECSMAFHLTCTWWKSSESPCTCPCHSDPGVQGTAFVPKSEAIERLSGLYYLPTRTSVRVLHLCERAMRDGATTLNDLCVVLSAAYESTVSTDFATSVAWLLDYEDRLDGCPPKPQRGRR